MKEVLGERTFLWKVEVKGISRVFLSGRISVGKEEFIGRPLALVEASQMARNHQMLIYRVQVSMVLYGKSWS